MKYPDGWVVGINMPSREKKAEPECNRKVDGGRTQARRLWQERRVGYVVCSRSGCSWDCSLEMSFGSDRGVGIAIGVTVGTWQRITGCHGHSMM